MAWIYVKAEKVTLNPCTLFHVSVTQQSTIISFLIEQFTLILDQAGSACSGVNARKCVINLTELFAAFFKKINEPSDVCHHDECFQFALTSCELGYLQRHVPKVLI